MVLPFALLRFGPFVLHPKGPAQKGGAWEWSSEGTALFAPFRRRAGEDEQGGNSVQSGEPGNAMTSNEAGEQGSRTEGSVQAVRHSTLKI